MQAASRIGVVEELVSRARAAYPQFAIDPDAFAGHLEACLGGPAALNVEDLYLAFAAGPRERHALVLVEQQYLARIGRYIAHLRQEASFIDEVRQALRERVLVGVNGK